MVIALDWHIRSNDPAVVEVIPDKNKFSYDFLNDTINKTLRYEEREYGINLGWGNEASGDNIRFEKANGSGAIVYEEDIAFCVNNGNWVKYGEREYGINLVWSNEPVYEWRIIGQNAGTKVTMDQIVGLYNTHPATNKTVQYGERKYGINLVWTK